MTKKLNDEQFEALKQYKELISHCKSVVAAKTAREIWTLWEKVRNCKSRFQLCSACVAVKVKALNKLIEELKDDPRWNEEETVEETVETNVEETVETTEDETVEETIETTEEKPKRNRKKKDNE